MWYHERASIHFTVARSFQLKSGVSHDLFQSSPVPAPLNDFAHGYASVRLGEARNPGPATHDRDRAAEQRNARHKRINEAGDSVPGSQDSRVRRVQNLQLGDTPEALDRSSGDLLRRAPSNSLENTFVVHSVAQIPPPSQEPHTTASCCTWFRSTAGSNSSFKKALHNYSILTAPPVSPATPSPAAPSHNEEYCPMARYHPPTGYEPNVLD